MMCLQNNILTVRCKWPRKKFQRQGAQMPWFATYILIRRKPAPAKAEEECSATQHMNLRTLQGILRGC